MTSSKLILLAIAATALVGSAWALSQPTQDPTPSADPETTIRGEAVYTCKKAVSHASTYPSKADFYTFSSSAQHVETNGTSYWLTTGKVDLMNEFGAMIPHSFTCLVSIDGTSVADYEITPEG